MGGLSVIFGLIIGGAVVGLVLWARGRDVAVKWYEWLIVAAGAFLLMFGLQNFFASNAEFESGAAGMYMLIMALPAVVLLAVAGTLIWRRQRAAG